LDELRKNLKNLKESVERTVNDQLDAADAAPGRVNSSTRRNIVVATNIGGSGATQAASSRQSVSVTRDGEVVHEVSETRRSTTSDDA
jgi:hypothetical protein